MSIIITSLPTKSNNFLVSASVADSSIGVALPLQMGSSGGYFQKTYYTIDQAKTNIKNLLMTMPGERLMHPSIGCGLYSLVFEQESSDLKKSIDIIIRETVAEWIPYVIVNSVDVFFDDEPNSILVKVSFSLKNDSSTIETLNLSIMRISI